MKTAINACTWNGYAKHHETEKPTFEQFCADAAAAGYDGVEAGGAFIADAAQAKATLAAHGLELAACSGNVTYNPWQPNTDAFIESAKAGQAMGAELMMVCGGFPISPRRNTYDFDYDMFGGNLKAHCAIATDHGLTVCYHPHRGAIVETAEETARLIERVPQLQLCVDTAHLAASGDDPVAFIERFAERIRYTHLKEYRWDQDSFTELGEGDDSCDMAACLAVLAKIGYQGWYAVELDKSYEKRPEPATPLESARISREFLRKQCI